MRTILAVLMVTLATMTGQTQDEVLRAAQIPPQFPGGSAALMRSLSKAISYPPTCEEWEGTVVVQFVVTKTGEIGKTKLIRQVCPLLDSIAMAAVKQLPRFIPGKQDGKPVDVWYTLPIKFRLQRLQERPASPISSDPTR